ncbi:hypothetical protein DDZ18_09525 [Marinicauda salina]|uniref:Uncharacterized protein n=1 Tax=Marinicauda salina TaxID=2135793 RepID=A0A2U2BSF3_9PROT|nr:hypothetical protein [Marinicauda salina]PWE16941.1 hypothetical protein DDZ18_09525 [Marinicauda salina]
MTTLVRYAAAAVAGLAMLALAGCLVSEKPLIGPDRAVFPLEEGVWARYETEDGVAELEWRGPVRVVDGVYTSGEDDFSYEGARFAEMREGVFIAQHPPEPGDQDAGWMYSLLYALPDGHFGYDIPICEEIPAAERERIGVALNDDDLCVIEDYETLVAAAEAFEAAMREERGGFVTPGYLALEEAL